jgi:hypothetical protein
VAAATNYVSHNGNHTGSAAPQAATVVVGSCGVPWCAATNCVPVLLSSHKPALIGSGMP